MAHLKSTEAGVGDAPLSYSTTTLFPTKLFIRQCNFAAILITCTRHMV